MKITQAAVWSLFIVAVLASHTAHAADRVLMYRPTTGGDCNYVESCPRWGSTSTPQMVTCTFDDPIPAEAILKQVVVHRKLAVQGPLTGYSNVLMHLNGSLQIGAYTVTNVGACNFNMVDYQFSTDHSPAGTPMGWVRGGTNTFTTTFVSTCCPRVDVDLLHDSTPPTYEFIYALDTDVVAVSGTPQSGVISHPVENQIVARTVRPTGAPLPNQQVLFEIVSQPPNATGAAIGANENATSTTYTATSDAAGEVAATVILGNKPGDYTVRASIASSPDSASATFVLTAKKPNSIAILKDTTDIAERADAYAVSSSADTTFHAVGLDAAGQRIGPIKCNWSVAASGPAATRGGGTFAPTTETASSLFHPTQVGKVKVSANPLLSGVGTAGADLFITKLYVSIDEFDPANPVDHSNKLIPGMFVDGSNVSFDVMGTTGQFISLHVLTGGAKGKATFTVDSTNYPGIANNWPLNGDTSEDMTFTNGQQSLVVDFDPSAGDTRTTLLIRDFGASGTIKVSIQSGKKTYELPPLKLPVDANGDGMTEAKWHVGSNVIDPAGLLPSTDTDNDNGTAQNPGDGLSAWEEMRGIVIGQHLIGQSGGGATYTRLNPRQRDLFIVADPEILAAGVTPLSFLAQLPMRVHYLFPGDVAGIAHNNRLLTAIHPVVNPNRNGIPGARPQGQRAIRVINQVQYPPTVIRTEQVPGGAPIAHTIPAWQGGIFGATILDNIDPDMIDHDRNGNALTQFLAETPNTTSFVEVYAKTFENSGIHTSFAEGLLFGFYDEFNNPVPQCQSTLQAGCDIWEQASQLILPQRLWGGIAVDELRTVPRYQGEHYSSPYAFCSPPNVMQPNGFSQPEMNLLRAAVAAHEIGHGMHMDHSIACRELMFGAMWFGAERGMSDIHPLPTTYSPSERSQIRLRQ
ncbi:MAG TPA: hypothetical protein VGQ36_26850 [Thermoanaerobaculia bacterium]|nr:hypothetical protein [Thermoanaerobaculia bacterium]